MGNSPTGTSETTDDEPEKEEPEVHPDQTDFDEHDTPETDDSDGEETPAPPAGGRVGGGGGGEPGAAPVTTDGEEASKGDEPEEEPPEGSDPQEPPESEEPKQPEETDEDEDEEQEQNEAEITVFTDPWDVTGWDNEPDLRRLQETFGDKLMVEYDFLPARTIEEWEGDTEMPTVDDLSFHKSTADSRRALTAAREQGLSREFLRRLHIAVLSESRDIENKEVLIELGKEVGLDTNQLREDMANVDIDDPEPIEEIPQMEVSIAGIPHFWTENIEFGRVFGRMVGEGVQPEPTGRTISQFVAEYEPVATAEVAKTFELNQDQAVEKLRQLKNVVPRDLGAGTFWFTI